MTALGVCLVLGSMLTLIQAASIESGNSTGLMKPSGLCEYEQKKHPHPLPGEFVPQCDKYGNFLPRQCSGSTGYCWCVNTITGKKIPNTETPPGVTPVNCGHKDFCPFGWSRFEEHCFAFINSNKSWIEAEAYCLFEEANLASVHSGKDNRFLQALTRGNTYNFPLTWIGGYYNMGYWMWTDGSMFDYENWDATYVPDSTKSCMQMNYGFQKKWINSNCDDMLPFVCAKRIICISTDASED